MSNTPNESELIRTAQAVGDDLGFAWGTRADQEQRAAVIKVDADGGDATQRLSAIVEAANAARAAHPITEWAFWREMFLRSVATKDQAVAMRRRIETELSDAFIASLAKYNA